MRARSSRASAQAIELERTCSGALCVHPTLIGAGGDPIERGSPRPGIFENRLAGLGVGGLARGLALVLAGAPSGGIARFGAGPEHEDRDRDHERDGDQPGADQVGEVVAGVERREMRGAVGEQAVGALGRERRQHREADRAAHLHAGVDQARGEARRRSGVAPDIASVISDGKEVPTPTPISSIGGSRSVR